MCGAMLSLSSGPTMPIRRSELQPEQSATLVGYGNGIASGHRQHDLASSLFATGIGANPGYGPGPYADAPNPTARAATAALPAPTPSQYAARAAGQNLQNLQSAALVRLAFHKAYAAPLIQQTWGTQGTSGVCSDLAGAHGRATRVSGALCLWPW